MKGRLVSSEVEQSGERRWPESQLGDLCCLQIQTGSDEACHAVHSRL